LPGAEGSASEPLASSGWGLCTQTLILISFGFSDFLSKSAEIPKKSENDDGSFC